MVKPRKENPAPRPQPFSGAAGHRDVDLGAKDEEGYTAAVAAAATQHYNVAKYLFAMMAACKK